MSKLPFPIFLLLLFSFYVFLYFSSYFFSFLFPSHSLSLSIQGASLRPQLPLPAGCSAPASAASACELLLCCRCFCLRAAPPLLLLPVGCLELRRGAAAWRCWLRPAGRARREMPGAAHEEADGCRRELPPAAATSSHRLAAHLPPTALLCRGCRPQSALVEHRPPRRVPPGGRAGKGAEELLGAGRSHVFVAPPRPKCSSHRDFRDLELELAVEHPIWQGSG